MRLITYGSWLCPVWGLSILPVLLIRSTTPSPLTTVPTTVYSGGRVAAWAPATMKNWPPFPGAHCDGLEVAHVFPACAIATVPTGYLAAAVPAFGNSLVGTT